MEVASQTGSVGPYFGNRGVPKVKVSTSDLVHICLMLQGVHSINQKHTKTYTKCLYQPSSASESSAALIRCNKDLEIPEYGRQRDTTGGAVRPKCHMPTDANVKNAQIDCQPTLPSYHNSVLDRLPICTDVTYLLPRNCWCYHLTVTPPLSSTPRPQPESLYS